LVPRCAYYIAKQRTKKHKAAAGHWRPIGESEAFLMFKDLCERANVLRGREAGGITFHSLRHTGASRASRVSKATAVMQLGGWQSLKQLARYDHPDEADLIRAVEAIGSRQAHAPPQKREKTPKSGRLSR
jgi:integrase